MCVEGNDNGLDRIAFWRGCRGACLLFFMIHAQSVFVAANVGLNEYSGTRLEDCHLSRIDR